MKAWKDIRLSAPVPLHFLPISLVHDKIGLIGQRLLGET